VIIVSSTFSIADYVLFIVQPRSVALKSWHALKTEMIIIFLISLAIINEKAGLMGDLIELSKDFDRKSKFIELTSSILNSVSRCRKITHRLLGFSKRIDIKIEPININHVINEVLDFLEKDVLYRKIDVTLILSGSLVTIESDHGQIQQILLNLLTNAFAAVEEFGAVEIESKNMDNGGVRVKISDNGCGIPPDVIKNIFDPFFSTKKEKGTGLGLSITYGIIKKLGGKISVDSKLGEGSVFTFELPEKPNDLEAIDG
ncbi:MAG TPA: two-component sensor histidine kinase, partial [Desulfobacterales bacterium]|nr:two-component sensor histidine kinase [Desulfobacterales bacterium]